jgi:hypothetical protein
MNFMIVIFSVALPMLSFFTTARIRWADIALLATTVFPSLEYWTARLRMVRNRIGSPVQGDDT